MGQGALGRKITKPEHDFLDADGQQVDSRELGHRLSCTSGAVYHHDEGYLLFELLSVEAGYAPSSRRDSEGSCRHAAMLPETNLSDALSDTHLRRSPWNSPTLVPALVQTWWKPRLLAVVSTSTRWKLC